MSTRSFVVAVFLLGAVACGGNDTLPTRPTPSTSTTPEAEAVLDIVAGDYHLTFTAPSSCALPTELMKRTYQANVKAWVGVSPVGVSVSGAPFYRDWVAGFDGTRDGDTVRFTIVGVVQDGIDAMYTSQLAEVIDQTKWLTYDGSAVVRIAGRDITTGTFDGLIKLRDAMSGATLAECRATDHRIEFVR